MWCTNGAAAVAPARLVNCARRGGGADARAECHSPFAEPFGAFAPAARLGTDLCFGGHGAVSDDDCGDFAADRARDVGDRHDHLRHVVRTGVLTDALADRVLHVVGEPFTLAQAHEQHNT